MFRDLSIENYNRAIFLRHHSAECQELKRLVSSKCVIVNGATRNSLCTKKNIPKYWHLIVRSLVFNLLDGGLNIGLNRC